MDEIIGTWDVELATPIGRQQIVLEFTRAAGGDQGEPITGAASSPRETVELRDLRREGDAVRWEQSIRHPIRLNLAFTVRVAGDRMLGEAKAGPLPSTALTGIRRPAAV